MTGVVLHMRDRRLAARLGMSRLIALPEPPTDAALHEFASCHIGGMTVAIGNEVWSWPIQPGADDMRGMGEPRGWR